MLTSDRVFFHLFMLNLYRGFILCYVFVFSTHPTLPPCTPWYCLLLVDPNDVRLNMPASKREIAPAVLEVEASPVRGAARVHPA